MSRKYCFNCTRPHRNGSLGMCDECLAKEELARNQEEERLDGLFETFMMQSTTDRWREIWDKMQ